MRFLIAMLLLVGGFAVDGRAADIAGGADHPLVSRYPGTEIRWYQVDNHRPYRVPVGPVTGYRTIEDWIDTAGRTTRIYYTLDGSDRTEAEVYANYHEALTAAGFEILAAGLVPAGARSTDVGSRQWREVLLGANPCPEGAVSEMGRGSATSGGAGSIVARKDRAAGLVYVVVTAYLFRADRVSILVDIIEEAPVETGLVVVDAEAIGAGIAEHGRVVLDGLLFEFDRASLRPESAAALAQIAAYLAGAPDRSFYVVGHTDARGTFAYNQGLAADRARAVVAALVQDHGVARDRLEPHGVGPLAPVFANDTDAGRERNRRVELVER